jgi:hypothetical protein
MRAHIRTRRAVVEPEGKGGHVMPGIPGTGTSDMMAPAAWTQRQEAS